MSLVPGIWIKIDAVGTFFSDIKLYHLKHPDLKILNAKVQNKKTYDSPLEDVLRNVGRRGSVPLDGMGIWLISGFCDDDPNRSF